MGVFATMTKGADKSTLKVFERVYDTAGQSLQLIDKVEISNYRDSDRKFFKVSKRVIHVEDNADGEALPPGAEPCEFVSMNEKGSNTEKGAYFFKDVAKIVAKLLGVRADEITPEKLDTILDEGLLEGTVVRIKGTKKPKTNGEGTYVQKTYLGPVSRDQLREILKPEQIKQFFPGGLD